MENNVEKEFVTYEQALALKELDYDEPCLAKFIVPGDLVLPGHYENTDVVCATITQNDICEAHVLAPTKSQVFRWFREKYELHGELFSQKRATDKIKYAFKIASTDLMFDGFNTYEEAEDVLIDNLIKLVKEKK